MFVIIRVFSIIFSLGFTTCRKKDIFLLAGQSNMAGRGGVNNSRWDHFVPPQCSPDSRILKLSRDDLTWEEAREPLNRETEPFCGVGPGMAFSNALLKKDPCISTIGLVPCAVGGTNLSEWQRGGILYNRLVERAHAALLDGGGRIRAMLWYQGESDCIETTSASMYGGKLKRFFSDVRVDLGLPLLPIVQVALGSTAGPYVEVVRKAQLELDLPNVVWVDAYELEVKTYDTVHLTTSAQVELGEMFADAVLSFDDF